MQTAIMEVLEKEADNEEAKKNMLSHLVYIGIGA